VRDVFWMIEWPSGRVLYVNDSFADVWGWPPAMLYANAAAVARPRARDDRGRVTARFTAEAPAGTFDCEYRIITRDGSVRYVRDRRFPVRGPDGDVPRIAGVAEDVTDRRRADALLHRERERAAVALASIAEGVITTDAAGRVESLNAAAERMLGRAANEARGRDIAEVLHAVAESTRTPLPNPVHAALRERRIQLLRQPRAARATRWLGAARRRLVGTHPRRLTSSSSGW
jgi:PAS domain S-box-containing protein